MTEEASHHLTIFKDLVFLAVPLLAALLIASIVFARNPQASSVGRGVETLDPLAAGFVSATLVGLLFYGLARHGEKVARFVVSGVIVGGTLSGLALLDFWFETFGSIPVVFYVAAGPLAYIGIYWSFRSYAGTLSPEKTSLLMAGSATLLGLLIGSLFPVLFTVIFLLSLSFLDVLLVETGILTNILGRRNYDQFLSITTIQLQRHLVGLGDFLVYSMLVAASLSVNGVFGAAGTISLILMGSLLTFQLVKSRSKFPGLSIPIWLGLIPSIVGLFLI